MRQSLKVQCCIAGGGPAGMVLGYLLGRAGVRVVVLEKHGDFLRDFRGDTVHPSTLRILHELQLLSEFLRIPHSELRALSVAIGRRSYKVADFSRLKPPGNFIALMPQWDFLNFLATQGRRFPSLTVIMACAVAELREQAGRVVGVNAIGPDGALEVSADLVVGCDGRTSTVRAASGLKVLDLGSPIDVLWFRLPKHPSDPGENLGHVDKNQILVSIDRTDYWQCAYVIPKNGQQRLRTLGLEQFRATLADVAPFLADRVKELHSFDDIKLLSVAVDRLSNWSRPGLLCIGDAAHAMSPIGGVGINLAVQDAVATANLLAAKLRRGSPVDQDLDAVRQRRLFPVQVIQRLQLAIQNRILEPLLSGEFRSIAAPLPIRLLNANAWLRRWPAQVLGVGVRPEHVTSPVADP